MPSASAKTVALVSRVCRARGARPPGRCAQLKLELTAQVYKQGQCDGASARSARETMVSRRVQPGETSVSGVQKVSANIY